MTSLQMNMAFSDYSELVETLLHGISHVKKTTVEFSPLLLTL